MLDFHVSLGPAHRKRSSTWLVQGRTFVAQNTSGQLCDGLLPQGKCKQSAFSDSEQKVRVRAGGYKASAAKSRVRCVSGVMPGHGLLLAPTAASGGPMSQGSWT